MGYTDAHRGTQLAHANPYALLAADKDCTFLAHYDVGFEDSILGITPIWSPGAIQSRRDGKFGGCAMVLSNATEYCSNGDFNQRILSGFTPRDASKLSLALETWPTSDCPNELGLVMKARTTGIAEAEIWRSYGFDVAVPVGVSTANKTFCTGVWVIGPAGTQVQIQTNSTNANDVYQQAYTLSGGWDYIHNITTFSATATNSTVNLNLAINQQGVGQEVYWTCLSLKQLPYKTAFGSVSGAPLSYPLSDLIPNRASWTFSGWFKPLKSAAHGGYGIVLNMGRFLNPASEDYLWFGWDNSSNTLQLNSTLSNGVTGVTVTGNVNGIVRDLATFYHLALVFDWANKQYLVYVNGALRATVSCASFSTAPDYQKSIVPLYNEQLFIGHNDRNNANIAASEVRFDRRVVTPDEIKSWANAKAPFYPRGIHRMLM